jgi:hypothetical protein
MTRRSIFVRPYTKDREILSMRVLDRSMRPLFPKTFQHDTAITAIVLASDQSQAGKSLRTSTPPTLNRRTKSALLYEHSPCWYVMPRSRSRACL